jgi:hypothetical protein
MAPEISHLLWGEVQTNAGQDRIPFALIRPPDLKVSG